MLFGLSIYMGPKENKVKTHATQQPIDASPFTEVHWGWFSHERSGKPQARCLAPAPLDAGHELSVWTGSQAGERRKV